MPIPNLSALSAKLTADYSGTSLTDAQVAAELNDEAGTHKVAKDLVITSNELLAWAGTGGRYIRILEAAEDVTKTDELRSACYAALEMVRRDGTDLDLQKSDRTALLQMLVTGGVLNAADRTALLVLAKRDVSWAVSAGYGKVREGWVTQAKV